LSPGTSLTWAPVRLLTGLSAQFSHRSVLFLSDRIRRARWAAPAGHLDVDLVVTQRHHLWATPDRPGDHTWVVRSRSLPIPHPPCDAASASSGCAPRLARIPRR